VCLLRFVTDENVLPQNGQIGSSYVSIVGGSGSYDRPIESLVECSVIFRMFELSIHGFFRERCRLRFSDLGKTCPHRGQVCPCTSVDISSTKNEKRRLYNSPRAVSSSYRVTYVYLPNSTNQQMEYRIVS